MAVLLPDTLVLFVALKLNITGGTIHSTGDYTAFPT